MTHEVSSHGRAASAVIGNLHVRRDGFDYHVLFRNKFGETKNEKLEEALATLQALGIFKPHVSLQKSGIRLCVTIWDGVQFTEAPGIEDLESTTPAEVEALIRQYLEPGALVADPVAAAQHVPHPEDIIAVHVERRSTERWFRLSFEKQNGEIEDGPMLIRANMAKLREENIFLPDLVVQMTAMNERLIIDHLEHHDGTTTKRSETFPLNSAEDAKKVEAALNACLKKGRPAEGRGASAPPAPAVAPVPPPAPPPAPPIKSAPPAKAAAPPAVPAVSGAPPKRGAPGAEGAGPAAGGAPPKSGETAEGPKSLLPEWILQLFAGGVPLEPEWINSEVFERLLAVREETAQVDERGYRYLPEVRFGAPDNPVAARVVLTHRFLVCQFSGAYFRFGPESRVSRGDDFAEFSRQGLLGLVRHGEDGPFGFVITPEFQAFLSAGPGREFRKAFESVLVPVAGLPSQIDPIWPLTPEEALFQELTRTARNYRLPVTGTRIVLDPNAGEFLGFQRTVDHGMEFRRGNDFARFSPTRFELVVGEEQYSFPRRAVLLGWAIDENGKICAICERTGAFAPPEHTGLVRFISVEDQKRDSLTVLATRSG